MTTTNMKSLKSAITMILMLLFSSCGTWYQATLNSRGISPEKKTYHITSSDSTILSTLEFKEYADVLKNRLNECGYMNVSPDESDIVILLDYNLGDTYLAGTYTGSYNYSTVNANTYVKSNTNASASANTKVSNSGVKTKAYGNSNTTTSVKTSGYSTGYTGTSSINTYKIPLLVRISAINKKSNETVWEVSVRDDLSRETQMQSVMPWLILSAQPYFGKSSHGEIVTKVNNTNAIKEQYNLIWPY